MTEECQLSQRTYLTMPKAFDEFMDAFSERIAETQKAATANYVSSTNVHRLRHGTTWDIHPTDSSGNDSFETISSQFAINLSDVANNDISTLARALHETADAMHREFAQRVYSMIGEAADSVGNSISAKDHASLTDAMYAALEKIEFLSDRFGKVTPPTMHVSPETGRLLGGIEAQSTPDVKAKFDKLIAAKTQAALDAETIRKSRFVRYGESDETSLSDRL
jgi:hypothetical protein